MITNQYLIQACFGMQITYNILHVNSFKRYIKKKKNKYLPML